MSVVKERISIDKNVPLAQEPHTGHNRWHPDIAPISHVRPGEAITLETRRADDCTISPDTTAEDILGINWGVAHPLTGPIYVEGAEPGDVLEIEFVEYESDTFGWTALLPQFGGFLRDPVRFPKPFLAKWTIDGDVARSPELPGIVIPGAPFSGCVGVAPSHKMMAEFRRREEELASRGGTVPDDEAEYAVPHTAAAGLRTIPPRETGGNMDNKALTAGSRLHLRVNVPGALFSIGDLHFAQGDGETCSTGIEMAGAATVRFNLSKNPVWRPRWPAYETTERVEKQVFATTGTSVSEDGRNEDMDLELATQAAVFEMIDYLGAVRGLTPEQAYVLISLAVDIRIVELVDFPNPIVSAVLDLGVFDTK